MDGSSKEQETYDRLANILDISIGRHPTPRPSDGEVWIHFGLVHEGLRVLLILATALPTPIAQLHRYQPRRLHPEGL